ncbi:MAG: 4-hydroxythreonine-4-phosphate dehydrogenase PdxA [Proteobacteria bacterium]|nr:4-hydroxythreonine-4-phosphate dehydrogenase PdxA [Pseudomonadota bacterium]MDA1357001.1 4-hydroxythreonine-4-phosphate dehydrogenase PdxA [Pseudomonadota bacterium]
MHAPIAVTMGEPAGIGSEIALKAWRDRALGVAPFFVIDSPARLQQLAIDLGLAVPVQEIDDPSDAALCFETALPVLALSQEVEAQAGQPETSTAAAVIESIERAVQLAQSGDASAVVTNPIQKSVLTAAGFAHPGHTEFLAALAGPDAEAVMMLACAELRVVPVTIHVALAEAARTLTGDKIIYCGRVTAAALTRDFGIAKPRLAFAGLNPHGGEKGSIGQEEINIIEPALSQLRAEGIDARGPLPADSMFHSIARKTYDAAICMYHDQALIPIKTIDFEGGVNTTLGLPFVRTSPDHGTALDIAGQGVASATSLIAALKLAAEMTEKRALWDKAVAVNS